MQETTTIRGIDNSLYDSTLQIQMVYNHSHFVNLYKTADIQQFYNYKCGVWHDFDVAFGTILMWRLAAKKW